MQKKKGGFGKKNLQINSDSSENSSYNNKKNLDNNFIDSQVEIGLEKIIFKNENFEVDKGGVKSTNDGKSFSNLNVNEIEVSKDFLGRGASGFVQKALYKPNGALLAIKSINILDKSKRSQLINDLKVLQNNTCPFLVKYYNAFFTEGNVRIVLEYMDLGSLDGLVKKIKTKKLVGIPEQILSKITQQILQGLMYLHKIKHLIHRDLKPGNILINSDGFVKITDFGIARSLENPSAYAKTFIGTNTHLSPERMLGKDYSYASDIWSLGLIVYELATGFFPYQSQLNNPILLINKIINEPEPTLEDDKFSPELQHFISRCLQKEPKDRDTATELCAHPWVLKYSDDEADLQEWIADLYDIELV